MLYTVFYYVNLRKLYIVIMGFMPEIKYFGSGITGFASETPIYSLYIIYTQAQQHTLFPNCW